SRTVSIHQVKLGISIRTTDKCDSLAIRRYRRLGIVVTVKKYSFFSGSVEVYLTDIHQVSRRILSVARENDRSALTRPNGIGLPALARRYGMLLGSIGVHCIELALSGTFAAIGVKDYPVAIGRPPGLSICRWIVRQAKQLTAIRFNRKYLRIAVDSVLKC